MAVWASSLAPSKSRRLHLALPRHSRAAGSCTGPLVRRHRKREIWASALLLRDETLAAPKETKTPPLMGMRTWTTSAKCWRSLGGAAPEKPAAVTEERSMRMALDVRLRLRLWGRAMV